MIVNVEQSSFSGVVLNVSWWGLRSLLEVICSVSQDLITRSMILDTRERLEMRELVFIKIRFFKQRRYCRLLESGMELTRAKRQTDYVSDSGNKDRLKFLSN